MFTTRSWHRLPVALLATALMAVGGVAVGVSAPAAPATVTPPAAAGAGRLPSSAILPSAVPGSAGTDFWVTFQRTGDNNGDTKATSTLYLTGTVATTGTVDWAGTPADFSVTPGQLTAVAAPALYNTHVDSSGADVVNSSLGVHITAADPITVYGLEYLRASAEAFLGIPTENLGTRYRAVSAPETITHAMNARFTPSRILVVGTVDDTTVTVTPSETFFGHHAGVPFDVTLDAGDVYTLASYSTVERSDNVTGTLVTSDHPVALFAGADDASRPEGNDTDDEQSQELAPTSQWGTYFLAPRFKSKNAGTSLTVVADTDGTNVTLNGGTTISLNSGDSYSTTVADSGNTAVVISSNYPVEVEQYLVNNKYTNTRGTVSGDPSAMLLPPITQWLSDYTFATPGTGFLFNAVNIVAPQSGTSSVLLDGTAINPADFADIPNTTDAVAQELLTAGSHTLSASQPFGISVYGANGQLHDGPNAANSYAYPGGSGYRTGEPEPQTIDFTGPPDTPLVDGTVSVSATSFSGLDVTFSSATPGVCTASGTTVTLLDHGTCTIDADQAGNGTYAAAPTVTQSFTVTESQEITFPQPDDVDIADGTVTLSASAPGGAVSFTAGAPSVCTVSGATVALRHTGTCTITADQAGGDGILAATSVTRWFQVKTAQTITFARPADTALGSGPVTLTASSSAGLPITFTSTTPAVCTVLGGTVTLLTAGTCTIAADNAGSATFLAAPTVMRSFVVHPADAAPTVVTSPTDVSVRAGATATFVAAATGYPTPSVQWQALAPGGSWTNIPGATGPSYTTGPLRPSQSGTQYLAEFSNVDGTVSTDPATVTVSAPPVLAPLVLVSQTLREHIEIAAHATRIPFTIRFNQSRPALSVVLTDDRTHAVLASTTIRPARAGTSFSGAMQFGSGAIHGYGSYTWTLRTLGGGPSRTFVVRADLREHSTLALHVKRTGARVTLTGAARVFDVAANRYRPWAARIVLIQEETRSGWVTIARTRTNGLGRVNARLTLAQHLTLRLVDLDTPNQWGRTSNTATT